MVVLITQILSLLIQVGPLAFAGRVGATSGQELTTPMVVGSIASAAASGLATALAAILLSGMLTVVVGRAVFGSKITIGEAWERVRGRLLALIGLSALEVLAVVVLVGAVVAAIAGIAFAANTAAAVLVGIPLVLALIAALAYLFTALAFAPVAIVLERKPVWESISRSFALVRNHFWRVLGIRLLAGRRRRGRRRRGVGTVQHRRAASAVQRRHSGTVHPRHGHHVRRQRDRPDRHRTVHRRCRRAALHRHPHPRRSVRPRPADRCGRSSGQAPPTDNLWLTPPR